MSKNSFQEKIKYAIAFPILLAVGNYIMTNIWVDYCLKPWLAKHGIVHTQKTEQQQ